MSSSYPKQYGLVFKIGYNGMHSSVKFVQMLMKAIDINFLFTLIQKHETLLIQPAFFLHSDRYPSQLPYILPPEVPSFFPL